jgi:hypothetical protein
MILEFERIAESMHPQWYVILDDYPGSQEDLQMVAGADILLDILSAGSNTVKLELHTTDKTLLRDKKDYSLITKIKEETFGGATYYSEEYDFELWLCNVMLFVFKQFPTEIYFKLI